MSVDPFAITAEDLERFAVGPLPEPLDEPTAPASTALTVAPAECEALTPAQALTFDRLLELGGTRPVSRPGLAEDLRSYLLEHTSETLAGWTESSMWFGKSMLTSVTRCEGLVVADRARPRTLDSMHPATAAGIVTHRAVQLLYTHPGRSIADQVRSAIDGSIAAEESFAAWWEAASPVEQSDLIVSAEGRTGAFLDSWPALSADWVPRFEQSMQSRAGRLVLGCKPDLTLGRPRADGRQTMLVVDLKSGGLADHHQLEADFYALVTTLRYGVPPFRSVVFSLASGEWTTGEITEERLIETAATVARAVTSTVDVLADKRPAVLTGGTWCRYCPVRTTCASAQLG